MFICAFDPGIFGTILETLTVEIGDKTWYDGTTESDQGGQGQGQGQEQALDRQGVQEFFSFRPHCCLFFVLVFSIFHPF